MSKYSYIINQLFQKWEDAGVVYCHWKSIDHLEATYLGETDIDVLVDEKTATRASEIALSSGFIRLNTVYLRSYPNVYDFVAYDEKIDKWIHLHFHTKLICGDRWVKAYHLPFEKYVLQERIFNKIYNSWTIHPLHELLVLFFRMNAKFPTKNWIKDKKIITEINFLLGQISLADNTEISVFLGSKEEEDYFYGVLEKIKKKQEININKIRKNFSPKPYRRMSAVRFFVYSKGRHLYRLYTEFRRRKLKKYDVGRRKLPYSGTIVSFVGIDGSGKSSGIEKISAFFAKQMNVQSAFLGSGKSGAGFIRKTIMNVFGYKATFKSHKEIRSSENTVKRPPIYYVAWILLCTKDREKQLNIIKYGLANGKLVLVDRWLQNSIKGGVDSPKLQDFVSCKGFLGRVARREEKLYQEIKIVPLHAVIKLNITPDKSVERKPNELTLEKAEFAITKMNEIDWPNDTWVIDIDANVNQLDVLKSIRLGIWNVLLKNNQ